MQLFGRGQLNRKKGKRIGRGGKRGTYSGRGTKGQKSRAGRVIRPAERDLILRIPKRRGFRNKPVSEKPQAVSLSDLQTIAGPVTMESLRAAGFLRRGESAKILGNGTLTRPVQIKGIPVSRSAKLKIEQAGGKVAP